MIKFVARKIPFVLAVNNRKNSSQSFWLALIGGSFILGLAASWQRWGNPLVDCGREMNQPLRLLRGQMLYSDVRHIYGPFSPYLNAALYALFGPTLKVLYINGAVTALLVIALTYWLSRQIMDEMSAAIATLSVMWLCVFKAAGNYFLPYSYSALHGTALSLSALALTVRFIQSELGAQPEVARRYLLAASVVTGLSILAKLEMGAAAVSSGLIAACLVGYPRIRQIVSLSALFMLPSVLIVVVVYAWIASRVGWHTLTYDSHLFLGNISPEFVYYNKTVSGFDHPWLSIALMLEVLLRSLGLAAALALFSRWIAARGLASSSPAEETQQANEPINDRHLWLTLISSICAAVILHIVFRGLPIDKGPYLAMPVLLAGLLLWGLSQAREQFAGHRKIKTETLVLLVIVVFALVSLSRIILRVRSGGGYGSYLLPASTILFTYLWTGPFLKVIGSGAAQRIGRRLVFGLLFVSILMAMLVTIYRYRTKNTYPLNTPRGTMITEPDVGLAFAQAINFINRETSPGDAIAVFPEGVSLAFFTDRINPLRDDIILPGTLDREDEKRTIERLRTARTKLIFITNRPTVEFSAEAFGRDYDKHLMNWIESNYERVETFGPMRDPNLQIGERPFFIHAYRRRNTL